MDELILLSLWRCTRTRCIRASCATGARRAPVAHDARMQRVRVHRQRESSMSSSIESLVNKEYQYGFVTDVESDTIAPGLTEDTVRLISSKKDEPEWLLEWRLKAFRRWQAMTEPHWSNLKYPAIDYQAQRYYSAPRSVKPLQSLDEVDPELLKTYD